LKQSKRERDFEIYAKVKYINRDIPLFLLFRALGVVSDKSILECIFYDLSDVNMRDMMNMIVPSLQIGQEINLQDTCLIWIGNKTRIDDLETANPLYFKKKAEDVLNRYFLPHIGTNT